MQLSNPLNIFYKEPDPDRWVKFDRYPRRFIRRLIRGPQRPGGVMMVALELMRGLEKLHIPFRFNDFDYARRHPKELVCLIGKPQLLFDHKWANPILFGAGVFSHPLDCPDLFERYPNVRRILVAGDWMQQMFDPFYGQRVSTWPVGIDTEKWHPNILNGRKEYDFLIYDKIRWDYDACRIALLDPVKEKLIRAGKTFTTIKYGNYDHPELMAKLAQSRAVIFLCEHETQGLAYQQILSTGTPVFAWDRAGFWQDPAYYPEKVKFAPVSAVPYWDSRCGLKFKDAADFVSQLGTFCTMSECGAFSPREFILENLTLETCARKYAAIAEQEIMDIKREI